MKKKAIISVLSKQGNSKDDNDIEVVTPGEFYKKDDCYYAVYNETKISGMEGTTTTMKIYPKTFSLIRMGTTATKMDFKENSENLVLYNTPYGILELKIETKDLKINVDDEGGEVSIDYNMCVSGQTPQHTILKVSINAQ
jgi:uncharacterized beta-barrel protein YwiB (DUF1934 family)